MDALRLSLLDQIEGTVGSQSPAGKQMAPFLIRRVLEERCAEGVESLSQGNDEGQPFCILDRERAQEERVECAEYGRVRADP